MKTQKKRRSKGWRIVGGLFGMLALAAMLFLHFGGVGTGESVDPEVFAAYAGRVEDISIPEHARIIALGEATHGNIEFQQLKLDVFKLLVERHGVRAFALEGDYGGCERVNRYIHGAPGTAREAAAAIGFAIYRTQEMEELISYMRQYNDSAEAGEQLRFYGLDMQRYADSFQLLMQACKELEVDTADMQQLMDGDEWSGVYDPPARMEIIAHVRAELLGREDATQALHLADMLLQYCQLHLDPDGDNGALRDRFMAENAGWIAAQELEAGCERIFIAAHNGHVARWGSYDSMGKLLAKEMGAGYYVIGTDFYKTTCNLPARSSGRRTHQVFYSHNPLAKAAHTAGLSICWLDFAKAAQSPELSAQISAYTYMGNLGERYSWVMRLLPPSYRIFQPPATLYDGMIFVAEANPTTIFSEE